MPSKKNPGGPPPKAPEMKRLTPYDRVKINLDEAQGQVAALTRQLETSRRTVNALSRAKAHADVTEMLASTLGRCGLQLLAQLSKPWSLRRRQHILTWARNFDEALASLELHIEAAALARPPLPPQQPGSIQGLEAIRDPTAQQ